MAIGLFVSGTVLGVVAPAFPVLLMARFLQGAGASIGLPLMYDIIMARVPKDRVGMMMGIAALIPAVAPTIGPSLGGFMVSVASWRMIFGVLLPLVVAALALGLYGLSADKASERRAFGDTPHFDAIGFVLLSIGFVSFVLGVNGASEVGWLGFRTLLLFALTALALSVFGFWARRIEHPLLNVAPLCNPVFLFGLAPVVGVQLIILGLGYLIPNFAQLVLGESALRAGVIMLPGCILAASLSPISGRLLDRFGPRLPVSVGMLAVIAAPLCFAVSAPHLSFALTVGLYVLFGIGQGNALGNSMTHALKQLPQEHAADGNSIANTAQQLASALGTSLASTCVAAAQMGIADTSAATLVGSTTAFYLLAMVGAVSLVGATLSFKMAKKA